MPVLDYLDKLRTEPEEKRQWAAFVVALVVTLGIVAIWLLTRFFLEYEGATSTVLGEQVATPLASLKGVFQAFFERIKSQ